MIIAFPWAVVWLSLAGGGRVVLGAAMSVADGRRITGGPGTTGRLAAGAVAAGRLPTTRGAAPDAPAKPQPGRGNYRYNDQRFQHIHLQDQVPNRKSQITNKDQVPSNKFQTRGIRSLAARLESYLCCERPGFLRVCVRNPRQS